MVTEIQIGGRTIGANQPCFIIAEAGVNHNGDVGLAHQLIDVALQAGADAIKFQTFKAERLVTVDAPKAAYQLEKSNSTESQFEMLRRLELDDDAHHALFEHCRDKRILFLSTPFDEASADFLDALGVLAFKTPSGEITNLPYLSHIARKNKPMFVSTGMAFLGEIEVALKIIEPADNRPVALLHCVSNYPADPSTINLRAIQTMARAFRLPVGYSDHTLGIEVPLAAVALGACIVEKHFTIDRNMLGPDHHASVEPAELSTLVRGIRIIEAALGDGRKRPASSEADTAAVARKSIVARRDIPAGAVLTQEQIIMMRPGTGLPSTLLDYVIGRVARKQIPAGTLISFEMIE